MADLQLPARSGSASGNRAPRGQQLPDAGDVSTVNPAVARDPGVRVSSEAFGATQGRALQGAGQGLDQISGAFAAAGERQRSREDAVARQTAYSAFEEAATSRWRDLQDEADISDPVVLQDYGKFLKEQEAAARDGHAGSPESALILEEKLIGLRSRIQSAAAADSVTLQRQRMAKAVNDQLDPLVSEVFDNPGSLSDAWSQWDESMSDLGLGLGDHQREVALEAGREKLTLAAIDSSLARGDLAGAKSALEMPGVSSVLSNPSAAKRQIVVAEHAFEKKQREVQAGIDSMNAILIKTRGHGMTEAELLRKMGIAPPQGPQRVTLSDKVNEYESVFGPASPDVVQAISEEHFGIGDDGGAFGNSLAGRALDIMVDGAPAYAAGLMDAEEERQFEAAVTQYQQPTTIQNPDTGILETRRPELPSSIAEAIARRGKEVPPPATDDGVAIEEPASPAEAEPSVSQREQTIWDLAPIATGPIPKAATALSGTPLVGQVVRTPQMTQAQTFIPIVQRDLVRILQNNPRYAEGERQAIEQEISIEPKFFDDPNAFRDRLVAIDDALQVRLDNALKTAQSSTVGRDERVQAMNVANGIVNFRTSLGVPPRVATPAEAAKLPPGSQFIDPQGVTRRVPEEGVDDTRPSTPEAGSTEAGGNSKAPPEAGAIQGSVGEDQIDRVLATQSMLEFASADELSRLIDEGQGLVVQLAQMELDSRTPDEAKEFLSNLDETMINRDTAPPLLRRVQEALVAIGHEVKVNGRYSAALLKAFQEATG